METRSFPSFTLPTRYRSAIAALAMALLPILVSAQTQKRSKSVALAKRGRLRAFYWAPFLLIGNWR